jgi:hypothetical protein
MAGTVTFVVEDDGEPVIWYLEGPEKNRVNVALFLEVFKVSIALVKDITLDKNFVMQADNDGLSLHTFEAGKTYQLTSRRDAQPTAELTPSAGMLSLFNIQRQDDSYMYLGMVLLLCIF